MIFGTTAGTAFSIGRVGAGLGAWDDVLCDGCCTGCCDCFVCFPAVVKDLVEL
jgi:hypothetical protein